jgi:hypothetical protein
VSTVQPSLAELLPAELLVDAAGHLSEEGAMFIADGEDALFPPSIAAHARSCEVCQHRVGDAALLSARVGAALVEARPSVEVVRVRRPVPIGAVGMAFLLAAAGAAPTLARAPQMVVEAITNLPWLVSLFVRVSGFVVRDAGVKVGPAAIAAVVLAAMVLMLTGWSIARQLPRAPMAQRGV